MNDIIEIIVSTIKKIYTGYIDSSNKTRYIMYIVLFTVCICSLTLQLDLLKVMNGTKFPRFSTDHIYDINKSLEEPRKRIKNADWCAINLFHNGLHTDDNIHQKRFTRWFVALDTSKYDRMRNDHLGTKKDLAHKVEFTEFAGIWIKSLKHGMYLEHKDYRDQYVLMTPSSDFRENNYIRDWILQENNPAISLKAYLIVPLKNIPDNSFSNLYGLFKEKNYNNFPNRGWIAWEYRNSVKLSRKDINTAQSYAKELSYKIETYAEHSK